eukprot:TRINITY_DN724_c0_g1_i1.p1 TRINITY_DN724_c0_g1~~TRINITY_DN724_c0_g1_i1.p1  ORF type:complete len:519 (+),score=117.57 TRINITY_DN724_c0_g1_i1:89-1558(+)
MGIIKFFSAMESKYQYDLFVIGGGSGGLASSKMSSDFGLRVGLADFVQPSPQGSTWGLGGTCVNVGCIPKKMMHCAALFAELRHDFVAAGWNFNPEISHDWVKLREGVQKFVKRLNTVHENNLKGKNVQYYNKYASFVDQHTVELTDAQGGKETVTAENILITVGGRPNYPDCPGGREYTISSDDIFALEKPPGKTLVIGASYVALECSGFLSGFGYDVTVLVRSVLLREYDQEMAQKIGRYMEKHGTKFIYEATPTKIEKTEDGRLRVTWKGKDGEHSDVFDTVFSAIGRSALTKGLNLEAVGVKVASNGKVIVKDDDKTTVDNIYSLGDCAEGRPEFTPTAIMAGRFLARRLTGRSTRLMNYAYNPVTVFTPLEYGCIGYTEEKAKSDFPNDITVFYTGLKPLEWILNPARESDACFAKLIVRTSDDRVIGLHYLGPYAGEITQGYAVAMLKGVTKDEFDITGAIHPTISEEMIRMTQKKDLGAAPK